MRKIRSCWMEYVKIALYSSPMANASLVPCSDAPCAQMDPHVRNVSMTGPISSMDNVLATGG